MRPRSNTHLDNGWVAVQVRILHEKKAAEHLSTHGYECFLPLNHKNPTKATPTHKSMKQLPLVPLFPGYLFCRYKIQNNFRIKDAPYVVKILGTDKIPAVIPESEIESLYKVAASGFSLEPYQYLKIGQKVRVNSGPCKGIEGFLVQAVSENTYKISVCVSVLEKSVVLTVINADVYAMN